MAAVVIARQPVSQTHYHNTNKGDGSDFWIKVAGRISGNPELQEGLGFFCD